MKIVQSQHFIEKERSVWPVSLLDDVSIRAFQDGELTKAYLFFGAHRCQVQGQIGYMFTVWAPHASRVAVVGPFNNWNPHTHGLFPRLDQSGIWEGFIPGLTAGELYKFHIQSVSGTIMLKADPYAFYAEHRPGTASRLHAFDYDWKDQVWMRTRKKHNSLKAPWSVYEMHLGSWMRPPSGKPFHTYRELVPLLIPYLKDMGFTHVEFMPIMEYPYDKSWGYQCTGYFAATSRYGTPEDLMFLIDALHGESIGVILDWVPSHFPGDAHGLYLFDGAHTYEYADMRKGFHPDWNSYIFNYQRGEVRSFLISSAHFWLDYYHADGLRVDAVNSIIRLDFSRKAGEWQPNENGTNENLEAIAFLKSLNTTIYRDFPDVQTIAEEASDWPGITKPVSSGGFGFGMKWMMGWMHDTFRYFKTEHIYRPYDQNLITFSMMYFYDEQFMLPLSHDEVVHGKSPMIYKMCGLEHQKWANLRVLYAYMFMHPGAKLLFMGNEFGQTTEWNEDRELDWHLLQHDAHKGLQRCVRDLLHLYRNSPALYQQQFDPAGFEWVEVNRRQDAILAFRRKGKRRIEDVFVLMNLSDQSFQTSSFTLEGKITWKELINTNHTDYGGDGSNLNPSLVIDVIDKKKRICVLKPAIPPLSIAIFG